MKAYIQYFDYDLAGKLSEPCGDRSVVILDGRENLAHMIEAARFENGHRRKKYPAFQIRKAEGFNRPFTVIYSEEV